ncbi:MAG: AMP-binding protein [Chlamydiales bacterium]
MKVINEIIPRMSSATASLEYFSKGQLKRRAFKEIYLDVIRVFGCFRQLNLRPQSRVGIIGTNGYEFVVFDLACIAAGLISVPFDPNGKYDLSTLINEYELRVIFTNLGNEDRHEPHVISFDVIGKSSYCGVFQPHQFLPDDILTIKFTSGSTQRPKAIEAKVKSADASIVSVQELFNHTSNDKILIFLPLHLLQQRYWIYSAILYNFNIVISSSLSVMLAIQESRPTVIMGVPFFYETMRQRFLAKNSETSDCKNFWGGNIRYLWTGSAPLSDDILLFYEQMGIPLFQGYGMNETCIVSKNNFQNHKIGSVGKLLPNIDIQFDEDGQILIKNHNEVNIKYYKGSEEETKATFSNGYVITGDLGYMDEEGYLFITGRKKDLIVLSSGKKINPVKIENRLCQSGLITNCMVYSNNSVFLAAFIEPSSPDVLEREIKGVIEEINRELLPEEKIFQFILVSEPFTVENGLLTSQYKLKRQAILNRFLNDVSA